MRSMIRSSKKKTFSYPQKLQTETVHDKPRAQMACQELKMDIRRSTEYEMSRSEASRQSTMRNKRLRSTSSERKKSFR